jgi:hypothetical protein
MPCLTRYLLIALMLVLLPLRGWASNVMAVDMAVEMAAMSSVKSSMSNASGQASMPADCAMHTQTPDDETGLTCSNCDTCELCLVVANLTPALFPFHQVARYLAPQAFSSGFTSAPSASSFKPPIF